MHLCNIINHRLCQKAKPSLDQYADVKKIAKQLDLSIDSALFIGDREERDGLCASEAGMPFLLIRQQDASSGFRSYFELLGELQSMQGGGLK